MKKILAMGLLLAMLLALAGCGAQGFLPGGINTPAEKSEDPDDGHTVIRELQDGATTYYCWDDGTATTEEAYNPSSPLTWTHPWNQNFYNIYSGHSDNGNVVYSEKSCTWCGNHKVYYLSYVRDPYDYTQISEYLCESCHVELVDGYYRCDSCGYYYAKYYTITDGEYHFCEYCWLGGQG